MNQIILHNYPQSPVAEKVRKYLGVKGLEWQSVLIPRIPPKPDLLPLTGGYRRTPVMQIGADIYCDSQGILVELERRFPEPDFHSDWGLARWSDQVVFPLAVQLVLGGNAESLPEDFAEDRGRLYFGPNPDWQQVVAGLPHTIAQLRSALGLWQDKLSNNGTGSAFLSGQLPGIQDVLAWYIIWFIRGRWSGGPELIGQFREIPQWEGRMDALGHGTIQELSAAEALDIAQRSRSTCPAYVDANDPQGLSIGQHISVIPDSDGGDTGVSGAVQYADYQTIAILRDDDRVGEVCVHFPRAGYRIITKELDIE